MNIQEKIVQVNEQLKRIENSISKIIGQNFKDLTQDQDCDEYFGLNFKIEELNVKFRKAKITPKKVGQFVTLWKRNSEKYTEPYNGNDNFDFYIILTEEKEQYGFFIFSKKILIEKYILTTNKKEGKRGFRIYPEWVKTENKQAQKTQSWQTKYFIDLTNNREEHIKKLKFILKKI